MIPNTFNIPEKHKQQISRFLQHLAESLDISENRYRQAEETYQAVGKWLGRAESIVAPFNPNIYSQGSFRLGTVIKPIADAEEYDIDLVCELNLTKSQLTQRRLKESIGHEIKGYAHAKSMKNPPKEGKRCWTLNYVEDAQFHMDILPAVPDGIAFSLFLASKGHFSTWSNLAIAITDKTSPYYEQLNAEWPSSNPRGYAEWFKTRMKIQFEARRKLLAESFQAKIENIPDHKVKTPLQQAIQLLKRHRDMMFVQDQNNKPISIIITTLAAHAYNNEADLVDTLMNIINGMPSHIQDKGGVSWVPNPVNPLENFADKWQQHPLREKNFRRWLQQVRNDLNTALQSNDIRTFSESLKLHFGEKFVKSTLEKHFPNEPMSQNSALVIKSNYLPSRFNVSHRQEPVWPVQRQYQVIISGRCKNQNGGDWYNFDSDGTALPKQYDLLFQASTHVPAPFDVYWQVVNTGEQARQMNQLRGDIFHSSTAGIGGLIQKEATAYTGTHWVECYVVKNGICVARSGEFVVNIE